MILGRKNGKFLYKLQKTATFEAHSGCNYKNDLFEIVPHEIRIFEGYKWDGCTPKWEVFGLIFGVWDGKINPETGCPQAYHASLVHDILYEFSGEINKKISRKFADRLFYNELQKTNFKFAKLYYFAVRIFGRFYWSKF